MNHPHEIAQSKEEARAKRRHKKMNPKMIVSGKGMKRFGAPRSGGAGPGSAGKSARVG